MADRVTPPTSPKVGVVESGIIFLNTEQNKSTFLYNKMFLIYCSLQIQYNRSQQPLKLKIKIGFQDRLSLNTGNKYCRILQESILQYF